jgi:hypothetical protein
MRVYYRSLAPNPHPVWMKLHNISFMMPRLITKMTKHACYDKKCYQQQTTNFNHFRNNRSIFLGPAIYSVNYSIPLLPTWQIYGRQKVARNKRKLWLSIMSCHLSNNSAKNDGTKKQIAGHRGYSNQVTTPHLKIALPMMVPPGRRCLAQDIVTK